MNAPTTEDAALIIEAQTWLTKIRDWQGEEGRTQLYRTPDGFKGSPFDYLRKMADDGLRALSRLTNAGAVEPVGDQSVAPADSSKGDGEALKAFVEAWHIQGPDQTDRLQKAYEWALYAIAASPAPDQSTRLRQYEAAIGRATGALRKTGDKLSESWVSADERCIAGLDIIEAALAELRAVQGVK